MNGGLENLVELIRSRPPDFDSMALELAQFLVHMENKFNIETFTGIRHNALVEITVAFPTNLAHFLASVVLSEAEFMNVRLTALQVLVEAAKQLADGVDSEQRATVKKVDDIVRIGTVTRRWGQRKTPQAVPKKNLLANVASDFFFPLLVRNHQVVTVLEREPILLSRLAMALGSILALARTSMHIERMCKALLDFVNWIRYHEKPEVRRAALFCVAQILATLPRSIINNDTVWIDKIADASKWVSHLAAKDTDHLVRAHAQGIHSLLSS